MAPQLVTENLPYLKSERICLCVPKTTCTDTRQFFTDNCIKSLVKLSTSVTSPVSLVHAYGIENLFTLSQVNVTEIERKSSIKQ